MDEQHNEFLKHLAVEISNFTIGMRVLRETLAEKQPGFNTDYELRFEQAWHINGPPTIQATYNALKNPKRSLSLHEMNQIKEE